MTEKNSINEATNTDANEPAEDLDRSVMIPDPPSNFSVDNSLSEELLKLSFDDRIAIQEEIHGVRCLATEETPQLIEDKLVEFDKQLIAVKLELQQKEQKSNGGQHENKSFSSRKQTNVLRNVKSISEIRRQQQQQPNGGRGDDCYLNDPQTRLRFLRCEMFDVPKAIKRLVEFLELTTELYGDYVAERPIRISDFSNRKEEVALQNSRNQYLPFRDRSGKRIFVGVGYCDLNLDFDLRYKIMMYLHWVASEDIETQQKGIVIMAWPSDEKDEETGDLKWEKSIRPQLNQRVRYLQKKLSNAMPVRVTSYMAYFADTPFWRALSALYYIGMDPKSRNLYKVHFGESTELRYQLSSYGIPEQLLPLSNTGTVKTSNHSRWINALRSKADREMRRRNSHSDSSDNDTTTAGAEAEVEIVDCPGSPDVIFRKGPTYKNNPGNMYFRELIEQTHDQHLKASRKEKCKITWQIVRAIEEQKGRFLDWCQNREMWIVATDREKIRTKVAACYKQYNRTALAFQKQQQLQQKSSKTDLFKRKQQSIIQQQQQQQLLQNISDQHLLTASYHTTNSGATNTSLRDYYDAQHLFPSTKRQKTFYMFCHRGYSSSSSNESMDTS